MKKRSFLVFVTCLELLAAAALPPAANSQADPPSRVARLSYVNGPVSLQPAGVDDWAAANTNRPLTIGDRVWTDQNARAELHLGTAAIRLGSETSFSFLNLDDNVVQMQLNQGTLSIRLRQLDQQEAMEVDTPNLAFSLLRPGEYRVVVSPDGDTTTVIVRSGEGEATGGGQAYTIRPREQATFTGFDSLSYEALAAPHSDHFDDWCRSRDAREDRPRRHEYVSPQMVGYQDLDDYGTWRVVSGYGPVWTPVGVPPGWAPYRYGHWAWIEPWGWTWVDDAPWGFAPFHYGRWAWVGNGWVWVPGPVVARPVYAPALVVFVGGSHFSMGLSIGGGGGGVGWIPLGPGERYVPAYRTTPAYIGRVNNTTNITNITNITNVTNVTYVNRTVPGGLTAVPTQAMTNSSPVATNAVKVPPSVVNSAQVVQAAPVTPVQKSVLGANTAGVRPPPTAVNRTVVGKAVPPPPPVPFTARQQALSTNPGRPLDRSEVENLRRNEGKQQTYVRPANPARPGTLPTSTTGAPPSKTQTGPSAPTPTKPQTGPVSPTPSKPQTPERQLPQTNQQQQPQQQQQQQEQLKKQQELERQRQDELRKQQEKQRQQQDELKKQQEQQRQQPPKSQPPSGQQPPANQQQQQQQEQLKKQQELERQRQDELRKQQEKQRQQQDELKKQQEQQRQQPPKSQPPSGQQPPANQQQQQQQQQQQLERQRQDELRKQQEKQRQQQDELKKQQEQQRQQPPKSQPPSGQQPPANQQQRQQPPKSQPPSGQQQEKQRKDQADKEKKKKEQEEKEKTQPKPPGAV